MCKTFGSILRETSDEIQENVVMDFMLYFKNELKKDMIHTALLGFHSSTFIVRNYFNKWANGDRILYTNFKDSIRTQIVSWLSNEGLDLKSDNYGINTVSWEIHEGDNIEDDSLRHILLTTTKNAQNFLVTDFYHFMVDKIKSTLLFCARGGRREESINIIEIFKNYTSTSQEYSGIWEEAWNMKENVYIEMMETWASKNEIKASHSHKSNYGSTENVCYISFSW